MKAPTQMVSQVLRIMSGIAALTLAGCQMHSPYGYDGGGYGYPSPGSGAMIGPSGESPYVTQPGQIVVGPDGRTPYYPSTNFPYPSSTYPPSSPGTIPSTGGTIPKPSSGPFSSTPTSPPINNSPPPHRPVEKLPPDSDEYPDAPQPKSVTNNPPSLSDPGIDDADFNADQGGKAATPKSSSEKWIDEVEKEGGIPSGDAAKKDPNLQKSAFVDDSDDEFAPPGAYDPGGDPDSSDDLNDPAVFLHDGNIYRGIVKFDDEEQTWFLRYERLADPETGEGMIYLAPSAKLSSLRNNLTVLIEGGVDNKQLDRFDRPMLVIKHLKIIVPE